MSSSCCTLQAEVQAGESVPVIGAAVAEALPIPNPANGVRSPLLLRFPSKAEARGVVALTVRFDVVGEGEPRAFGRGSAGLPRTTFEAFEL